MALAKIPLLSFLAVSSLVPVIICALSHYERRRRAQMMPNQAAPRINRYQLLASLAVTASVLGVLALEQSSAEHEGYFWMEVHCFCVAGLVLYGRIADARYSAVDRQYYSYIFSLVVLLPASLYLEEAFAASHFEGTRQVVFAAASVGCAIAGVAAHFHMAKLRVDKRFSQVNLTSAVSLDLTYASNQVHHLGCALLAVASLGYFTPDFASWWSILLGLLATSAAMLIPSHLQAEESEATNMAAMTNLGEASQSLLAAEEGDV